MDFRFRQRIWSPAGLPQAGSKSRLEYRKSKSLSAFTPTDAKWITRKTFHYWHSGHCGSSEFAISGFPDTNIIRYFCGFEGSLHKGWIQTWLCLCMQNFMTKEMPDCVDIKSSWWGPEMETSGHNPSEGPLKKELRIHHIQKICLCLGKLGSLAMR